MIHLIVGNTGSGKTTYAQKLKAETNGIVFSIDKWNKILFLPDKRDEDGLDWFLERIDRAEEMILGLVEELEFAEVDSILDLGLSRFRHRQKFRNFAREKGFEIKLHFLDIPKEVRLQRVLGRNKNKGETFEFEVTQENFDFMESWFEAPEGEELAGALRIEN